MTLLPLARDFSELQSTDIDACYDSSYSRGLVLITEFELFGRVARPVLETHSRECHVENLPLTEMKHTADSDNCSVGAVGLIDDRGCL